MRIFKLTPTIFAFNLKPVRLPLVIHGVQIKHIRRFRISFKDIQKTGNILRIFFMDRNKGFKK